MQRQPACPTLFTLVPRGLILAAAASLAAIAPLTAQALGRLADVQVIDRDSGETLPVIRHGGDHWIAGRPGARYAVSLQNRQAARVLGVVSVDGVNVISGETAALYQTGYVLAARQAYRIAGWRKSDQEVASFHFSAAPASYAARTGRPDHLGVIGVALFREKVAPPAVSSAPMGPSWREGQADGTSSAPQRQRSEAAESLAKAGNADSAEAESTGRSAPMPAARLGTGHGERERDRVAHTTFERRSERPDEIVRIRYDSRENLIAMGIIPSMPIPIRPQPFPESSPVRYAPDPY